MEYSPGIYLVKVRKITKCFWGRKHLHVLLILYAFLEMQSVLYTVLEPVSINCKAFRLLSVLFLSCNNRVQSLFISCVFYYRQRSNFSRNKARKLMKETLVIQSLKISLAALCLHLRSAYNSSCFRSPFLPILAPSLYLVSWY